jgi:hypothetical protein
MPVQAQSWATPDALNVGNVVKLLSWTRMIIVREVDMLMLWVSLGQFLNRGAYGKV